MKTKSTTYLIPTFLATGFAAFLVVGNSIHAHTAVCPPSCSHTHEQNAKSDAGVTAKSLTDTIRRSKTSPLPQKEIEAMRRSYLEQAQDPQHWVRLSDRTRAGLARNYATFIRRANFSPEEAEQFLQVMTEKALSYSRILAVELGKGDTAPAIETAKSKALLADAQYKTRLSQFMGDERFRRFNDYIGTLPGRVQVEITILAHGENSFTDGQMDYFAEVFTDILRKFPFSDNSPAIIKTRYDSFLEAVQGYLSPEEMKTLSGMFKIRAQTTK